MYPVLLDLKGKNCLVFGGGKVATRKVRGLLEFQANVKVISLKVSEELKSLEEDGKIQISLKEFEEDDLKDCFLVIGSTDNKAINRKISESAKKRNILVNIVDDPTLCNFFVPSIIKRGDFILSISTSGKSPALSRKIREEMEKVFPKDFENFLEDLSLLRKKVKNMIKDVKEREKFWSEFFGLKEK